MSSQALLPQIPFKARSRPRRQAKGLTEGSGDSALDTVLGEIDLRVAVELAKAGIR